MFGSVSLLSSQITLMVKFLVKVTQLGSQKPVGVATTGLLWVGQDHGAEGGGRPLMV